MSYEAHSEKGGLLAFHYIQRENKNGTEKLYSSATSSQWFYSSLDGELASTTVATAYSARVENGSFNAYTFSDNEWVVGITRIVHAS